MTVYVDQLIAWPHARHRCFKSGSCHLVADTVEELHAFAAGIGLRRSWFQDHPIMKHYDLSPPRRAAAIAAGAIPKTYRELREILGVAGRRPTVYETLPESSDSADVGGRKPRARGERSKPALTVFRTGDE